jgi:proteic killer suppression protein
LISSFGDKGTDAVFHGAPVKRLKRYPAEVVRVAVRKLDLLNAAGDIQDLRVPPGNRLEALKGDLEGYHSIRVNQQWRIVFRWEASHAHEVRLLDYH